jgi:raffinose/stachyose/melibiose transport system substrate-binding protein
MKAARWLGTLAVVGAATLAIGCGTPGEDSDSGSTSSTPATTASRAPDVAAAGDVTLTVWDQEVRGGQAAQIRELNRQFMEKYPNVTIRRVAKSFDDLNTTLKLAVSGPDAPDVVQANQGLGVMGQLVRGRLLRPVDDYARVYDWESRYPSLLIDLNRFEADGTRFGSGDLYGLSQMGEIVGVFYNKRLVRELPRTLEEFEAQLEAARAAGDVPIQFGNLDKWPGIHEYETVLGQVADKQEVRDFTFQADGASFDTAGFRDGAAKLQEWADKGYFTPDFNGVGYDPAWQQFAKGNGHFLIAGTWLVADLADQMGEDVGFMLMPGREAGADPVALGGEGLPFTITSKSANPDVAAAYIDFLTDENAARVLTETNNLAAMKLPTPAAAPGLPTDVAEAWRTLGDVDGLIPYLDYTTPTFGDDLGGAIQELTAGKQTPDEFTSGIQQRVDASKAGN